MVNFTMAKIQILQKQYRSALNLYTRPSRNSSTEVILESVEQLVTSFSAIPTFKKAATTKLEHTDSMQIALAKDKKTLAKFRPYIENEPLILVDLEGDQLGPRGEITFIQINTFMNERCYLIDILEIGNDELKNEDGWLR